MAECVLRLQAIAALIAFTVTCQGRRFENTFAV